MPVVSWAWRRASHGADRFTLRNETGSILLPVNVHPLSFRYPRAICATAPRTCAAPPKRAGAEHLAPRPPPNYSAANWAPMASIRTAANLNSGILPMGSIAELVKILAEAST